jgi:sugar lactone lactonase YvrE
VGVAIDNKTGDVFVANCRGNFIARITKDRSVTPFAQSALFKCPNGLALNRDGTLYVANFRSNQILKVDAQGAVAPFVTVSKRGLGHLCLSGERLFVTAYESHELYEVTLKGAVKRMLGNGERGLVDGADPVARLTFPNGIACHPWDNRLYINEYVNESIAAIPRRMIVRQILLDAPDH